MAAERPPATPTPARPTASAAIPSTPQTPTTPRTANAAAAPACGERNPSEPRKEVAPMRPERLESPKPSGSESAFDSLLWLAVVTALAASEPPPSGARTRHAARPGRHVRHPGPSPSHPRGARQRGAGPAVAVGPAPPTARHPVGQPLATPPPDRPGPAAWANHAWPAEQ